MLIRHPHPSLPAAGACAPPEWPDILSARRLRINRVVSATSSPGVPALGAKMRVTAFITDPPAITSLFTWVRVAPPSIAPVRSAPPMDPRDGAWNLVERPLSVTCCETAIGRSATIESERVVFEIMCRTAA